MERITCGPCVPMHVHPSTAVVTHLVRHGKGSAVHAACSTCLSCRAKVSEPVVTVAACDPIGSLECLRCMAGWAGQVIDHEAEDPERMARAYRTTWIWAGTLSVLIFVAWWGDERTA